MHRIKGIIAPILTPMLEDESINEEELKNQVNRLIDSGIHGIFAVGTNGEGYALSESEKVSVIKTVVKETNKRVPVYAGVGCVTTKETIRLARIAEEAGSDILSIITPYFAKASQEELYEHYESIAKEVQLPIVLYNIPARTGNGLAPSTVKRLSEISNIVGIKDSSGNFDMMLQYIEAVIEKDFAVLSGNDSLILWNLLAGGNGAIAGCANVYPQNMTAIYEHFIRGDIEAAKKAQDNIRSFRNCFQYGNPNTIVKKAAAMLGNPVGNCRRPFNQLSKEGEEALKSVIEKNREMGIV